MKGLRRTTTGGLLNKHYHIAYVDSDSGIVRLGQKDGHTHEARWVDAVPEQVDPESGQVVQAATPGYFEILPAEDGHTHDRIIKYSVEKVKGSETDEELFRQTLELAKSSYAIEKESLDNGDLCLEFTRGKQWDSSLKNRIEDEGRAALTINLVAKYVNELVGHEIQNRTDIRYLPQEDGDQRVADILNILVKQLLNQCYFDREKTKVFRQAVITGRGVFNCYVDFSRNLEGEIKVECYPFREFKAGSHEKEDLSDAEYIIKDKVFSIGKLKQLYPDKAEDIDKRLHYFADYGLSPSTGEPLRQRDYRSDLSGLDSFPLILDGKPILDITKKEALVIECWRKIYIETPVAVNPDYGCYENVFAWKKEDIDSIETIEGFEIFKRPGTKFRITKIGCGVVLKDDYCADLPVDDFFVVPVYANKDGNFFWGKVFDVLDAQRGVNKRYSQAIDIGNRMASYGWFYDEETFTDETELQKFKQNSSTPGFTQKVENLNKIPIKIEGVKFPSEIVQLMELDTRFVGELMNISTAPRGANTSAQALLQEQKIKLTGNEFLFDGLSHALVKLGRLLIKMIQKYYTADRIFRIVQNAAKKKEALIAGQPFDTYSEEELISLLETADLDQYDVEIAEAPNSPATRLTVQSIVTDLMQKGAPIPPQVPIRLSDLPDEEKKKLISDIESQQASANQAQETTRKMEIEKTLIGQGIITDSMRQEFGIQASQQQSSAPQEVLPPEDLTATTDPAAYGMAEFRG